MARRFLGWRMGCVDLGPVWSEADPPPPPPGPPQADETDTGATQADLIRDALTRLQALRAKQTHGYHRLESGRTPDPAGWRPVHRRGFGRRERNFEAGAATGARHDALGTGDFDPG
ncbi:hypothetical protein [uncultured Algimonas sp.]|uniref:hypothetical protein n=1 Tax=uncultured Algimonas sp. TaxID=1547920 RepID=UPI002609D201|nr:hypothetical protein [uncultured Algimonas sp.]